MDKVRGHYRTLKTGERVWVEQHKRKSVENAGAKTPVSVISNIPESPDSGSGNAADGGQPSVATVYDTYLAKTATGLDVKPFDQSAPNGILDAQESIHDAAIAAGYVPRTPFLRDASALVEVEPGVYRMEFQPRMEPLDNDDSQKIVVLVGGARQSTVKGQSEIIVDTNKGMVNEFSIINAPDEGNSFKYEVGKEIYPANLSPQEIVNWWKTPSLESYGLGSSESRSEAMFLMKRSDLSSGDMLALASHPDPKIRILFAEKFAHNAPESIQQALIDHTVPTSEDYDTLKRKGLAQSLDGPAADTADHLDAILGYDPDIMWRAEADVRAAVARVTKSKKITERLSKDKSRTVLMSVAVATRDSDILNDLALNADWRVRCRVALNSDTPLSVLKSLGKDSAWDVSQRAKSNEKYPKFFKRLFL